MSNETEIRGIVRSLLIACFVLFASSQAASAQRTMKGQLHVGAQASLSADPRLPAGGELSFGSYLLDSYIAGWINVTPDFISLATGHQLGYFPINVGADYMYRVAATRARSVNLYVVGGIPVPKNSHLMARCQLSDRLELEFENIEIGGRILHLGYEAYDVDGSKGIYCPDVSGTGKQVRSRGSNIISSALTGRLGRIAGEVVSTGVSIAQNAGGEITVSVPAGYTFYIVKSKR